ncbi:rab18 GTP-binding protein, putative, partial [Bodo saltans]
SRVTFESVLRWLEEVRTFCGDDIALMLIGNKIDLCQHDSRPQEVVDFAKKHNMLFAMCSAKTKEGVAEAFDEITRRAVENCVEDLPTGVKFANAGKKGESRGNCC